MPKKADHTFHHTTTTANLTENQLIALSRSDNSWLLRAIEKYTILDTEKIRLVLELGIESARDRLANIDR